MSFFTLKVQKPNTNNPENVLNLHFENSNLMHDAAITAYDMGYEIVSEHGPYIVHQDMTDVKNTLEAWW